MCDDDQKGLGAQKKDLKHFHFYASGKWNTKSLSKLSWVILYVDNSEMCMRYDDDGRQRSNIIIFISTLSCYFPLFQHFVKHEAETEIRGCKLQASHLFHPPLRIQIESHWYANSDYTLENYRSIAFTSTNHLCMHAVKCWMEFSPLYSLYSLTKCLFIKGEQKRKILGFLYIPSCASKEFLFELPFLFSFHWSATVKKERKRLIEKQCR